MDELKQLVIRSLEAKGVLGQLRAKLRSMVFDIIDEQEAAVKQQSGFVWENPLSKKILETEEGELAAGLIREFLEFYRMDYSLGVFLPECNLSKDPLRKPDLSRRAGLDPADAQTPLLIQMIHRFKAAHAPGAAHPPAAAPAPARPGTLPPEAQSHTHTHAQPSKLGGDDGGGDTFGVHDLAESLGDDIEQSGGSDKDIFGVGRPNKGKGTGGLASLGNLPPLGAKKPGKLDPMMKFG